MDVVSSVNNFGWADWSTDSCIVDYDKITIKLVYTSSIANKSDVYATIQCINYIGFSFIGHWDENIIESIMIEAEGDLITRSLQKIKNNYGEPPVPSQGGGTRQFDNKWYQLSIKLIDGTAIEIVCDNFIFDVYSE